MKTIQPSFANEAEFFNSLLEGVVSKVRNSAYLSGRSNDWVKVTCAQRETLPIAGFALDGNKWDGLYIGRRKGKDLIYAGKVDHGFDTESANALRARLTPLIRKTQPYSKHIARRGIWVEPELLAEIEYRAKSAEGKVRHPFFKGLRERLWSYLSTAALLYSCASPPCDAARPRRRHRRNLHRMRAPTSMAHPDGRNTTTPPGR